MNTTCEISLIRIRDGRALLDCDACGTVHSLPLDKLPDLPDVPVCNPGPSGMCECWH